MRLALPNKTAALSAVLAALLLACPLASAATGGTDPGAPAPKVTKKPKPKPKPKPQGPTFPISKPTSLGGFLLTEYWPVPEKWFRGKKIIAPGLKRAYKVDFLYSASGVAMEGDGKGEDGSSVHWERGGSGWAYQNGAPYWLEEMYWKNAKKQLTYPLADGGWSRGKGVKFVGSKGTTFAPGPSLGSAGWPLHLWASVAVDPSVIKYGSAVYVPAFRSSGRSGWFCAQDTGGAIIGRHLDIYRPAPSDPSGGESYSGQVVRVLPPQYARAFLPFCHR